MNLAKDLSILFTFPKDQLLGISLVVQLVTVRLSMQGAQMGSIPGPGRFHKLLSNEPRATTTEAPAPRAKAPQQEKPLQ